jgi:hypothetical protein
MPESGWKNRWPKCCLFRFSQLKFLDILLWIHLWKLLNNFVSTWGNLPWINLIHWKTKIYFGQFCFLQKNLLLYILKKDVIGFDFAVGICLNLSMLIKKLADKKHKI